MSIIKIVNVETGKEIERPMTQDELKDWQAGCEAAEKKQAMKKSALAKLAAIGLTEEEIAAL